MYRVSPFVRRFAWALLGGSAVATVWVNLHPASYYDALEWRLLGGALSRLGMEDLLVTPMSVVSDLLMSVFLFFVAKELWEAIVLQRGALSGRRALLPAGAVLGGGLGAALAWIGTAGVIASIYGAVDGVAAAGWPVTFGSDIVIGYVLGRAVFGASHPALHLLLLITIAGNIAGLLILGIAAPETGLSPLWLLLPLLASLGVWLAFGRTSATAPERVRRRSLALWPYILAGGVSWIGVAAAGLPPALGLLPVIPAIPHADRAFGFFAEAEEFLHDPLNRLSHLLVKPLAVILFLFGLTRGGIDLAAFGPETMQMLAGLWLGKPLGGLLGALCVMAVFRLSLPAGMGRKDLALLSLVTGMGFTLPLLSIDTALPGGAGAEAARLGAALSLLIAPVVLALAPLLRNAKS